MVSSAQGVSAMHATHSSSTHGPGDPAAEPSDAMLLCIQDCLDCHRACLQTLVYCTRQGGPHADPHHLRLMMDCAQVCQTSADFMLRHSPLHAHTCRACAEVCQACADDCDRMASDPRMKACADTCRHCAESCRQMAGQMTGGHPGQGPAAVLSRHKTE